MTSYLRSWFAYAAGSLGIVGVAPPIPEVETPTIDVVAPQNDDDSDAATVKGDQSSSEDEDEDAIPVFPALNSAQRMGSGSSHSRPAKLRTDPRKLTDAQRMPPPPLPSKLSVPSRPGLSIPSRSGIPASSNTLTVPSSSLGVPSASSLRLPPAAKPPRGNRKVALAPGHGPLDWAIMQRSGRDLRGVCYLFMLRPSTANGVLKGITGLQRVTPSMLKQHNKREDAWIAVHGKVYNMTHYLSYHPGGEKQIMRAAGRDGTKLFRTFTLGWLEPPHLISTSY